jgi:hypothetical protein
MPKRLSARDSEVTAGYRADLDPTARLSAALDPPTVRALNAGTNVSALMETDEVVHVDGARLSHSVHW